MANYHPTPNTQESHLPPALFTFLADEDQPERSDSPPGPVIRFPAPLPPAPVLDAGARQNLIEYVRWQRAVLAAPFIPRAKPPSSSSTSASTSASTSPPNFPFTPPSSSPASTAQPPPGFAIALDLPDSSTAICTNRFPVSKRHYCVLELRAVNTRSTDYLLCDSLHGGLFHGTAPWGIEHFNFAAKDGMEVPDFMVANEPMRPVAADFFFPRFECSRMTRYFGALGNLVHMLRENVLDRKEFLANRYAYHERFAAKIAMFENLPPHHHVAQYRGVVVGKFSGVERVEAMAFRCSKVSLFSYASTPGSLQRMDVEFIFNAVAEGLDYLHGHGIVHGNVSSCNVFLTLGVRKVDDRVRHFITNVVLGGFEKTVCVADEKDAGQRTEKDRLSLGTIKRWMMNVTS